MSIYIQTHIVQKGETLEDIVSKYSIPDVEMLRNFHNKNVPQKSNLIGSSATSGREILIPGKEDIEQLLQERIRRKEDNKAIEIGHLKNQILYPNFLVLNTQYSIKIVFGFENKSDEENILSFHVYFKYIGTTKEDLPILQYQKEHYLINDKDPELKLYDLSIQSTDFLYPMEFSLNTPAIPHKIINLKEIGSRWEKTKQKVKNTFADSYSQKYINFMSQVIEQGLQKYIMRDLCLQFFFAPYAEYTKGKSIKQSLFHSYRILYQNIMEIENEQDTITIKQTADCIDQRTPQQILERWNPENDNDNNEENTDLLESSITGEYHLDKQNKTLQTAKVQIKTLFYDKPEKIEISINRI
ncbi:MAG: hypothetical protein LBE36_10035 [Flavobacteriaceae bacterium]|jgi:hypothetical protein|nr:hypothetical protein [Flavobacteriaceae bacterium]